MPPPSKNPSSPAGPNPTRPGEGWLVLTPTEPEAARLAQAGLRARRTGLGPVAAAGRSAAWIARERPARVVLVGCAGTYDTDRLPIGTAAEFDAVSLWGVGVGQAGEHQSWFDLGWADWTATEEYPALEPTFPQEGGSKQLVSVCAASTGPADVATILEHFPEALGEDMESYGVAMACRDAGVPFHCVRGISNQAGDRDPSRWKLPESLDAAAALTLERFPNLRAPRP